MSKISQCLAEETELVRQFLAVLDQELDALKHNNDQALTKLSQDKTELVDALNLRSKQRTEFLLAAGFPNSREGIASWLETLADQPEVASQWHILMDLARAARRGNTLNGELINKRLTATTQAMNALKPPEQRQQVYGRNGQTTSFTGSRVIDAA